MKLKIRRIPSADGTWRIVFSKNGRVEVDGRGYNRAANSLKTIKSIIHDIQTGNFVIEKPSRHRRLDEPLTRAPRRD